MMAHLRALSIDFKVEILIWKIKKKPKKLSDVKV